MPEAEAAANDSMRFSPPGADSFIDEGTEEEEYTSSSSRGGGSSDGRNQQRQDKASPEPQPPPEPQYSPRNRGAALFFSLDQKNVRDRLGLKGPPPCFDETALNEGRGPQVLAVKRRALTVQAPEYNEVVVNHARGRRIAGAEDTANNIVKARLTFGKMGTMVSREESSEMSSMQYSPLPKSRTGVEVEQRRAELWESETAAPSAAELEPQPQTEEPEYEVKVPRSYSKLAAELEVDSSVLKPFFEKDGLKVMRCYSAWKYRKNIIEEWAVQLSINPYEPLIKLKNYRDYTQRLLLPDLYLAPQTHPRAVECFADYVWPKGDKQLLDTRHMPVVLCNFRNCREPLLFVCPSDEHQRRLMKGLLVVQQAAIRQHQSRLQMEMSLFRRCPEDLGDQSSPFFTHELAAAFIKRLSLASKTLCTSHAISNYWLRHQLCWVLHWDEKTHKFVRERMALTIHRLEPYLVFLDWKKPETNTKNILRKPLDLVSYSCTRKVVPGFMQKNWSDFIKSEKLSPHVTFIDCLTPSNDSATGDPFSSIYGGRGSASEGPPSDQLFHREEKIFISFETTEQLKDLQQVLATLSYLQMMMMSQQRNLQGCTTSSSKAPATSSPTKSLLKRRVEEPATTTISSEATPLANPTTASNGSLSSAATSFPAAGAWTTCASPRRAVDQGQQRLPFLLSGEAASDDLNTFGGSRVEYAE